MFTSPHQVLRDIYIIHEYKNQVPRSLITTYSSHPLTPPPPPRLIYAPAVILQFSHLLFRLLSHHWYLNINNMQSILFSYIIIDLLRFSYAAWLEKNAEVGMTAAIPVITVIWNIWMICMNDLHKWSAWMIISRESSVGRVIDQRQKSKNAGNIW